MKIPVTSFDRRYGTRRDQVGGFRKSVVGRLTMVAVLVLLWAGIFLAAIREASR